VLSLCLINARITQQNTRKEKEKNYHSIKQNEETGSVSLGLKEFKGAGLN
jgi:hypothetical protein